MSLKIFSTNSNDVISLFTQFSSFCLAHSTDALSSSGHMISASRFLFGCKIGRTYLIPSKSRIERNQKLLTPENTLAVTHHDKQKQVEVKRSSRANPHEIRIIFGCPYYFTLPRADHSSFIISHSSFLPH